MISGVRASPRQRHLAGRATRLAAALMMSSGGHHEIIKAHIFFACQ